MTTKQVVYVMHEYPVMTQTFVENEARALEELGHPVIRYALHHKGGTPLLSTSIIRPISAISSFVGIFALIRTLLVCLRNIRKIGRILFSEKFQPRDFAGQIYALCHAVGLSSQLYRQGHRSVHLHGHFLGRCLDVVSYSKVLLGPGTGTSATAHAADAANPRTPSRFSLQVNDLNHVICASKSVAEVLRAATKRQASAIVHCGITPPAGSSSKREGSARLKVLTVARLVEKKGLADCLSAAVELQRQGIAFEWRIIGDGPLAESLRDKSSRLVDQGLLTWMGAQPSHVVHENLRTWADAFVLPCKLSSNGDVDGIPVALMEAMTSEVAVVSSNISGIPELISHNQTGLLITPGNVQELVICISSLRDNEFRNGLINAAKIFVDTEFNQLREAQRLRDVILGA